VKIVKRQKVDEHYDTITQLKSIRTRNFRLKKLDTPHARVLLNYIAHGLHEPPIKSDSELKQGAFMYACANDKFSDVKVILASDDKPTAEVFNNGLKRAAMCNCVETLAYMLSLPQANNTDLTNVLANSIENFWHPNIIKLLIAEQGTDLSANNNKVLRCACSNSDREIIKLLLNNPRVKLEIGDESIFTDALFGENYDRVKDIIADFRVQHRNTEKLICV